MYMFNGNLDELDTKRDIHWKPYIQKAPGTGQKKNISEHCQRCSILVADGEGFEPPVELPPQRFSRPSHSTALPTILIFSYITLHYILHYFFRNATAKIIDPAIIIILDNN